VTSSVSGNTATMVSKAAETQPIISVESLWKVFGRNPGRALHEGQATLSKAKIHEELGLVVALKDISFDVMPGETFVVMGLSGSGKSTLVRCLIRLIEITVGKILVSGEDITGYNARELREFRRSKMAMVFQNFGLLPHKNVLDNAAYGLEIKGVDKEKRHNAALEVLNKVGLAGWEGANPRQLSGGMQQRVGLARALTVDPTILLMDEPFSGLDPLIRRQMREELTTLQSEIQKTIVFITHDLDEAITIGDRIAIMRDGEMIQIGTPSEIIANPADDFVAEFTQGISKGTVLNVANIVTDAVVVSPSDSASNIREIMNNSASDYAVCVSEDFKYLGMISKERIDTVSEPFSSDITDLFEVTQEPIHPYTTLNESLHHVGESNIPTPVTDRNNVLLGVVTQQDLLKMLVSVQRESDQ